MSEIALFNGGYSFAGLMMRLSWGALAVSCDLQAMGRADL